MGARGDKSKARIIRVTRELLRVSNPDAVSLDEIAAKAEIAKSSIMWHFGGKEQLLLAVIGEVFDEFMATFAGRYGEREPLEKVKAFIEDYSDFVLKKPEANTIILLFILQRRNDPKVKETLTKIFAGFRAAMLENLELPDSPGARTRVSFLIGALDGVFLQWLLEPDALDLREAYALLIPLAETMLAQNEYE